MLNETTTFVVPNIALLFCAVLLILLLVRRIAANFILSTIEICHKDTAKTYAYPDTVSGRHKVVALRESFDGDTAKITAILTDADGKRTAIWAYDDRLEKVPPEPYKFLELLSENEYVSVRIDSAGEVKVSPYYG